MNCLDGGGWRVNMTNVSNISISLSTINGKQVGTLDFSTLSAIEKGGFISLSASNGLIELESPSNSSLSNWLDWIVTNYNMQENINAVASKDGSSLVLTATNSDNLNILLDLGKA